MSEREQERTIIQTGKLIIGVTGNIATGKSAIMRLAQEQGALTLDADKIVHHLMDSDINMQAALAVAFGPDIRLSNGRINRKKLGELVFNDPVALRDLEQMVHPSVRIIIAQYIQEAKEPIIFIEAIKLLEGPLAEMCHQIWVTRCHKQRQLERLMICRGLDSETATKRIDVQPPQEEKVAQADVVIDTAGLMRETEAQFDLYWQRLPSPSTVPPLKLRIPVDTGLAPPAAPSTPPREPPKAKGPSAPIHLDRPLPKDLKARLGRKIEKTPGTEEAPEAFPKPETAVSEAASPISPKPLQPILSGSVEVRRARPSDIPSILLLIHKATEGDVRLKRSDMLLALGERSYFIGQKGTEVQAVIGWNIENLVSRVTELYFHPREVIGEIGPAVFASIEESADSHICEIIIIFLPDDAPAALTQLLDDRGYTPVELTKMPPAWRDAIQEAQPPNTTFVVKTLRERISHPL